MVGNSLRSDILPVLAIGGQAVYVPYAITWQHESVDLDETTPAFHRLDAICELPALIACLAGAG
jgi:putative hydrolase of the HAD superfamily